MAVGSRQQIRQLHLQQGQICCSCMALVGSLHATSPVYMY